MANYFQLALLFYLPEWFICPLPSVRYYSIPVCANFYIKNFNYITFTKNNGTFYYKSYFNSFITDNIENISTQ